MAGCAWFVKHAGWHWTDLYRGALSTLRFSCPALAVPWRVCSASFFGGGGGVPDLTSDILNRMWGTSKL